MTVRGRLFTHLLRLLLHAGAEKVVEPVTFDQFIERCDRCQVFNRDQIVCDVHLEAGSKRDDPADPLRDILSGVLGEHKRTVCACAVGHKSDLITAEDPLGDYLVNHAVHVLVAHLFKRVIPVGLLILLQLQVECLVAQCVRSAPSAAYPHIVAGLRQLNSLRLQSRVTALHPVLRRRKHPVKQKHGSPGISERRTSVVLGDPEQDRLVAGLGEDGEHVPAKARAIDLHHFGETWVIRVRKSAQRERGKPHDRCLEYG